MNLELAPAPPSILVKSIHSCMIPVLLVPSKLAVFL